MRELFSLEDRIKAVRNVINNSTTAAKSPIIAEAVLSTLSVYLLKNKEKMFSLSNNQFNSNIHFRNIQLKVNIDILNGVLEYEKHFQKRFPDSLDLNWREAFVQIRAIAFCTVEFLIGGRGIYYVSISRVKYINSLSPLQQTCNHRLKDRRRMTMAEHFADIPPNFATYAV